MIMKTDIYMLKDFWMFCQFLGRFPWREKGFRVKEI